MATQKYCLQYPITNAKSPIEQGVIHSIYPCWASASEARDRHYHATGVILSINSYT